MILLSRSAILASPCPTHDGRGVTNANGQTSIETRHRTENIHHFKERVVGGDDSFSFTHFVSMALLLEDYYLPMSVSERPHGDTVRGHGSHRAAVDRNNLQDFASCYCAFSFPKAQPQWRPKRTKEAVLAM